MECLTLQDFVEMENIERQYFDSANIMPAKESYEIYLRYPKHICVLREGYQIIGFTIILSLKEESYMKVRSGVLQETKLAEDDLDLTESAYSYIYLSTVAIDEKHRSAQNTVKFMRIFRGHVAELLQGVSVKEAMVDVVTDEGAKIATRFFKMEPVLETKWNSTIYCVDGDTFAGLFGCEN